MNWSTEMGACAENQLRSKDLGLSESYMLLFHQTG